MQPIVVQSAPGQLSAWLHSCLASVQEWCAKLDYQYILVGDDEFFDPIPKWYLEKCSLHIQPATDLARLLLAERMHNEGHELVIWVDADVLVLAPEYLRIEHTTDAAMTREVWLTRSGGRWLCKERVNNAVCVFRRGSPTLQYLIARCLDAVQVAVGPVAKAVAGTDLLTTVDRQRPFQLLHNIGNLSPHVLRAINTEDPRLLHEYFMTLGEPLYAANLSWSNLGRLYAIVTNDEGHYERAISKLRSMPQGFDLAALGME
jgi:hypothetical protein